MWQVYVFLSRPQETEEVLFWLRDGAEKKVYNIPFLLRKKGYIETGYETLSLGDSFLKQEGLDSIKNGELRLFVFADNENWSFPVFDIYPLEICAEEKGNNNNGLELGKSRLSQGARLRKEYQDLQDFHTAYNTLDITNVPYAGPGGVTVSPVLLQVFARMLLSSRTSRKSDISFALMCLGKQPVPKECPFQYISNRLGIPYREMGHSEIYKYFVQIAGTGNTGRRQAKGKEGPAVF